MEGITYTSKIESVIGSISELDQDIVSTAKNNAVKDIVSKVISARPDMANLFSKIYTVTDNDGFDVSDGFPVISVERKGFPCRSGNTAYRKFYSDPSSMYFATLNSPVYVIYNTDLFIHPTPTVTSIGEISKVVAGDISVDDTTIDNFPSSLDRLFVLTASSELASLRVVDIKNDAITKLNEAYETIAGVSYTIGYPATPSYTPDDIEMAEHEFPGIDMTTLAEGSIGNDTDMIDVTKWISTASKLIETEEDIELATATLSKASTYLNMYATKLNEHSVIVQKIIADAEMLARNDDRKMQTFAAKVNLFGTQVQAFLGRANARIEQAQVLMKAVNDYSMFEYNMIAAIISSIKSEIVDIYSGIGVMKSGGQQ